MCQVVRDPFLKRVFSSLWLRVDININIGSITVKNNLGWYSGEICVNYYVVSFTRVLQRVVKTQAKAGRTTTKHRTCAQKYLGGHKS